MHSVRLNENIPEAKFAAGMLECFQSLLRMIRSHALFAEDDCFEIFAVQAGDVVDGDSCGTRGFAFAGVGAGAEAFFIHLSDHVEDATCSFWLALRQQ